MAVGWYRVVGLSGTQILNVQPPAMGYCGTTYPVYYSGTLPTYYGQIVSGTACFYDDSTYPCYFATTMSITNGGTYNVYYLPLAPGCNTYVIRYCTE
ncbi:unnamed protein product [Didymodactylos carnosus]|uniref:Uncharacterized protein n=1 Tax=Didymodactylos carnosus TaxID=1234261 RepID=A0A8S2CUH2_9BILA|nr:unnamed protein product [Didymodactylos carnosus]CAF3590355.1 unnamed protein product [Didymodactylos carnosus]